MKRNDLLLLLLVAGGAWYLYTRSRGLSLTGQYENPMIAGASYYGAADSLSPVSRNASTSTAATNVFSAISTAVAKIAASIAGAGNTTSTPASSPYGNAAPGPLAGNAGVSSIGDVTPAPDSTLSDTDPYWMWNETPAWTFEQPTFTRPESPDYIPPMLGF